MKCPHCLVGINLMKTEHMVGALGQNDPRDSRYTGAWTWRMSQGVCPECQQSIIYLCRFYNHPNSPVSTEAVLVYPKGASRSPVPTEVPPDLREDYKEACLVLQDSPKASAALSRRCLQHLLRTAGGATPQELSKEIDEVMPKLPSYLADAVDAIRHVGNFAAHPLKSTSSGEIVDVEPGEAEWQLDTLEQLFDYYFVAPAKLKVRRDEMNKKLADAGKPPLK